MGRHEFVNFFFRLGATAGRTLTPVPRRERLASRNAGFIRLQLPAARAAAG